MAIEIRDFTVTIPAGTPISAGFTSSMSFPARIVTEIHIRVPPGPRGEVGFAIGTGGLNIVPYGSGTWIVTDNEDLVYPLTSTIDSGAWELLAYNTGSFDHTLRVYFYCELVTATASAGVSILPGGSLSGGTGSGGGPVTPPVTPPVVPPVAPPPVTPPVVTPPVTTPPGIGTPVILPPPLPVLPGQHVAVPVPSEMLIGVADAEQVWLLVGGVYLPVGTQQDVTDLSNAGVAGAAVSGTQHKAFEQAWAPARSAGAAAAAG